MNISGIVVKTAPEHIERLIESLKASGLCEIHFTDGRGRVIVTVEGEGTDQVIGKMRGIMDLPNVLCADLAYSYSDIGTDISLQGFNSSSDAVPDVLRSLPDDVYRH